MLWSMSLRIRDELGMEAGGRVMQVDDWGGIVDGGWKIGARACCSGARAREGMDDRSRLKLLNLNFGLGA